MGISNPWLKSQRLPRYSCFLDKILTQFSQKPKNVISWKNKFVVIEKGTWVIDGIPADYLYRCFVR